MACSLPQFAWGQLQVVRLTPTRHGLTAPVDAPIHVEFDRPVDPTTLSPESFSVFGRWTGPVSGTLQLGAGNRRVTFTPHRPLSAGDLITVSLSQQTVRDRTKTMLQAGGHTHQFWDAFATGDQPPLQPARHYVDGQSEPTLWRRSH